MVNALTRLGSVRNAEEEAEKCIQVKKSQAVRINSESPLLLHSPYKGQSL